MKILFAMLCACVFAAASYGCNKGKSAGAAQTKKIGGCTIETIKIGTGKNVSDEAPSDAAWIRVSSVEFAENELYKKAALDLAKALEMRGVRDLQPLRAHARHGRPLLAAVLGRVQDQAERSRRAAPSANSFWARRSPEHRPGAERPDGYGPFFITCGFGSSDWWTVWYRK